MMNVGVDTVKVHSCMVSHIKLQEQDKIAFIPLFLFSVLENIKRTKNVGM